MHNEWATEPQLGWTFTSHGALSSLDVLGTGREPEYLVKWVGKSHMHDEWVTESLLMRIGKRKLINFRRRYSEGPCDLIHPAWRIPERFVARRPSPLGPGWEVLTKWTKLGYEACTWEVRFLQSLPLADYEGPAGVLQRDGLQA